MKKLVSIILVIILFSCNSENAPDCFQNAGAIIEKEFDVDSFAKITVFPRVELIVIYGPTQKVILQTGEYLINDIEVNLEDGRLNIYNNNACNFTRDYGITKVFVTSPNLTEIRNASQLKVRSESVLTYDSLSLFSEDFNQEGEINTNGNFQLEVDCNTLEVFVNNLSSVLLSG
jgi:hypothetical protein